MIVSCNTESKPPASPYPPSSIIETYEKYNEFKDGEYCAEVIYSNPNTGKVSEYELIVEVVKGSLIVIHWPNGGRLDESHFESKELNDDGAVSFFSDKGYKYDVQLLGERPCKFEN